MHATATRSTNGRSCNHQSSYLRSNRYRAFFPEPDFHIITNQWNLSLHSRCWIAVQDQSFLPRINEHRVWPFIPHQFEFWFISAQSSSLLGLAVGRKQAKSFSDFLWYPRSALVVAG